MKSITQLIFFFLFLAGAHALAPPPEIIARGPNPNRQTSYRRWCDNTSLERGGPAGPGWVLSATCYPNANKTGARQEKSIELDKCVANYNGHMSFAANGYFSSTCDGCELRMETKVDGAVYLACLCRKFNNNAVMLGEDGYLDLARSITYYDGELRCNV